MNADGKYLMREQRHYIRIDDSNRQLLWRRIHYEVNSGFNW